MIKQFLTDFFIEKLAIPSNINYGTKIFARVEAWVGGLSGDSNYLALESAEIKSFHILSMEWSQREVK